MVIFYFLKNKDSANRMQWPKKSRRILFGIAEVQPILSKDSANRMQWPKKSRRILFGIAEVQPILSKDNQKG